MSKGSGKVMTDSQAVLQLPAPLTDSTYALHCERFSIGVTPWCLLTTQKTGMGEVGETNSLLVGHLVGMSVRLLITNDSNMAKDPHKHNHLVLVVNGS